MISIIGAGPAGSYAAYLLAKGGEKVALYEEHSQVGYPLHCTGIVTQKLSQLVRLREDHIKNTLTKARVYSPDSNYVELLLQKNYVLDRQKLDTHLASLATKAGAVLHTNAKFLGRKDEGICILRNGKKSYYNTNLLVGADGPLSAVAASSGMANRQYFTGIQAIAGLENRNVVEFYPGVGDFAWVVPESRHLVRIGVVARKNLSQTYQAFLRNRLGENYSSAIRTHFGGLIPIYNHQSKRIHGRTYLTGDAGGFVKATTGGGLVPGMMASKALSKAILSKTGYEAEWRAAVGRELHTHLLMRKMLDCFSAQDYNNLVRILNKERFKKLLGKYNRDTILSLMPMMLLEGITEPGLLRYVRYLPSLVR